MTAPYYTDDAVTLWTGNNLQVLAGLPDESVDCIVTSPPYYGLRSYLPEDHPDKASEHGAESSPAEYVETMRAVFSEARRVLTKDGTLWLNLGDSYSTKQRGSDEGWDKSRLSNSGRVQKMQFAALRERTSFAFDRPGKNLMGMPWRVAFALQDDGWILRNDIIWSKPNGMPESVTDRLSTKHEHLFLFTRSPRYWFNLDAIREPLAFPAERAANSWSRDSKEADVPRQSMRQHRSERTYGKAAGTNLAPTGRQHLTPDTNGGRNPGDVWTIPTQPFPGAHFAAMPLALAQRCLKAGCKPNGTVLDPYSGSGTVGLAAAQLGHRCVGIDINPDYHNLALSTRLAQSNLIDGGAA